MKHEEFFDMYFKYVEDNTEAPFVYHRWSMLVVLAAHMGANIKIPMGHFTLTPNFYVQLVGDSGIRKSSAISIPVKLAKELGVVNIAPSQISREALISLLGELSGAAVGSEGLGDLLQGIPMEVFTDMLIPADEFNAFMGDNRDSYMLLLSQLWDGVDEYDKRLTDSVTGVEHPYVNLISANTFVGFAEAFSGKAVGMGMLTRMLVVPWHERRGFVPFPSKPDGTTRSRILEVMESIHKQSGSIKYTSDSQALLGELYQGWKMAVPVGMEQYSQRRFTHLLKLCAIFAAIEETLEVTKDMVYNANTMLASNEQHMSNTFAFVFAPRDVGVAMSFAYDYLKEHRAGATLGELLQHSTNVCSATSLTMAINDLTKQKKIKVVQDNIYIFLQEQLGSDMLKYINLDFLTTEERKLVMIQRGAL